MSKGMPRIKVPKGRYSDVYPRRRVMCILQKSKASTLFFLLRMPGDVRFPILLDRVSGHTYLLSTKSWTDTTRSYRK